MAANTDKSGVQSTVLSLPSGPGSIEGLGESFQPQLNTGTASYSIPFDLPPGRAGFAPSLGLQYNGGDGNGPVGLGWRLNLPSIQRQTDKGLPYYTDYPDLDGIDNDKDGETDEPDEWDSILAPNGEELVPLADGSLRQENESDFTRYQRDGAGWLAVQSDGTQQRFGTTAEGRIQDDTGRVFRWLLESLEDTNGNRIELTHERLDTSPQRYCRFIRYNGAMQVELIYDARPDIFVDYRPRFAVTTALRLAEVRMSAGGEPVRAYRLAYAPTDDTQAVSLLTSVTQVGRDGESTLPPAQFGYTRFVGADAEPVSMPTAPLLTLNDGAIDLLDIDADGLPDILDTRDTVHDYYRNLGPDAQGIVRWSSRTGMAGMPTVLDLASDAVQLADLDGDGHTDLLKLDATDARVYRIRDPLTAPAWEGAGQIRQALFNFRNPDTRLVDQNNDKRIDVMRTTAFGDVFVWLNRPGNDGTNPDQPNRWSSAFTPALPNPNLGLDRATTRLADMNGDRVQDLVWIQNDLCTWYPGRGFGEFGTPVPMANPPVGVLDNARLLMADVNGDGLSDALYVGNGSVRVWLNLGFDPTDPSRGRFANAFSVDAPYTASATVFRQADINGNGSQDILWNTHPGGGPDTFAFLDFAPGEQPYLLKTITNGIGLTTTVSYRSSVLDWVRDQEAGQPWPQAIPFPVPVIARVEANDGLATYVTEYQYHDGYYDGAEQEFRGFAAAEQHDIGDESAPDLITAQRFDTGVTQDALKGKPLELEARTAAAAVFHREQYTWNTRTLATAAAGASADDRAVTFAYQSQKLRTIIEQGNGEPVQLQWDYEYDNYGNRTRQVEHGRLDTGIPAEAPDPTLRMPPIEPWDDERVTQTLYTAAYAAGLARWILSLPVEQTTTDENGVPAARTRTYYDGSTSLGEVTRGNPTRTEGWIEADDYAVTDRRDYDSYGNVVAIYDALYDTAAGASGGHYRDLTYDDIYHSFPVSERIHTGERTLTVSAGYDAGLGAITESTDFNGHRTSYGYDTFGRLSTITKPLDTAPTLEYTYVLAHPLDDGKLISWVETRQRETADGGTLDARSFYDGLGRAVMTRAEGEDPGQIVVSDTVQFNARKQPWRRYLPYFEQGSLDYSSPTFASAYTEHQYDALGREIRMTQPDGTHSETLYEPLGRTLYDEEQTNPDSPHYGAAMRYVHDGLLDEDGQGRLRQVYEITPEPWLTQYSYDLLDNFTGYIDAQNNRKFVEYDGLRRKTFMDDPDRGHIHCQYDSAGNLVRTTDAKGQVVRYTYDGINRLTGEYHDRDPEAVPPDVSYHYDVPTSKPLTRGDFWPVEGATSLARIRAVVLEQVPAARTDDLNRDDQVDVADLVRGTRLLAADPLTAYNTLGRLAWVEDQSGAKHLSYDARGRTEWQVKRIEDSQGALWSFFAANVHDSMDRVVEQTYPDGSRISLDYNARGLLESVPEIIDRYDYNPVGQNAMLALANGVTTTYSYDQRLRLSRLRSLRQSDDLPLQDLSYTYDRVSNITAIIDGRDTTTLDAIGLELGLSIDAARKFDATQHLQYDNLYQLTRAANDAVYGAISYRYDRIGNLVQKNASGLIDPEPDIDLGTATNGGSAGTWDRQGRAIGDPPGPHALTATTRGPSGPMIFRYDANGNLTTDGVMTLGWDEKDRLVEVTNGNNRAQYAYDYTDIRKRKVVTDTTTKTTTAAFYIDPFSEVRNGELLKYVYAGDRRVARTDTGAFGGDLAAEAYFLHDHLGSTHLSLADDASVLEQFATYPFGYPRLEGRQGIDRRVAEYGYTGKETDQESSLMYYEARYYEPATGRFVNVDPLFVTVGNIQATGFGNILRNSQVTVYPPSL